MHYKQFRIYWHIPLGMMLNAIFRNIRYCIRYFGFLLSMGNTISEQDMQNWMILLNNGTGLLLGILAMRVLVKLFAIRQKESWKNRILVETANSNKKLKGLEEMNRLKRAIRNDFWLVLFDIVAFNLSYYLALLIRFHSLISQTTKKALKFA